MFIYLCQLAGAHTAPGRLKRLASASSVRFVDTAAADLEKKDIVYTLLFFFLFYVMQRIDNAKMVLHTAISGWIGTRYSHTPFDRIFLCLVLNDLTDIRTKAFACLGFCKTFILMSPNCSVEEVSQPPVVPHEIQQRLSGKMNAPSYCLLQY